MCDACSVHPHSTVIVQGESRHSGTTTAPRVSSLLWDQHQVTPQHWCPEAFVPAVLVRRSIPEKGLSLGWNTLCCSPAGASLTLPPSQSTQGQSRYSWRELVLFCKLQHLVLVTLADPSLCWFWARWELLCDCADCDYQNVRYLYSVFSYCFL